MAHDSWYETGHKLRFAFRKNFAQHPLFKSSENDAGSFMLQVHQNHARHSLIL